MVRLPSTPANGRRLAVLVLGLWAVRAATAAPAAGSPQPDGPPRLVLDRGEVALRWEPGGADGRLTATAVLQRPVFRVVQEGELEEEVEETVEEAERTTAGRLPSLGRALAEASPLPLRVPRVEIHAGTLHWIDPGTEPRPEILVTQLEAAIENLSTHESLAPDRPALITASGRVGRSGDFRLFVTANPWSRFLDFAGRAQVVGLELAELTELLEAQADVRMPEGRVSLFAEFVVRNGEISGGVKTLLEEAEVRPADDGLLEAARGWLLDQAVALLSDRVPGREAVGTVIPLEGRVANPDLGLGRALGALLRNAFLEALSAGFREVPPVTGDGEGDAS